MSDKHLLDWTGHPLVDVGIATLCNMCDRDVPTQLTLDDLDAAAEELRIPYFSGVLNSYLTCVFMNSEYVQPGSGTKKEQSRNVYVERVLKAHRSPGDAEAAGLVCAFSGQPATHLVHRGQIPMITGEGVLNFFPNATGGLPISGPYLTAIQALPMGGRRAEGKLLIAHADDPRLRIAFARKYLEDNRRLIRAQPEWPASDGVSPSLLREQGSYDTAKKRSKMPDAKAARTLITCDLMDLLERRQDAQKYDNIVSSVTVYWLSSSGQGPSLTTFDIPSNVIRFLDQVRKAQTAPVWNRVVARGWPSTTITQGGRKKKTSLQVLTGPGRARNLALEQLIQVFTNGVPDRHQCAKYLRRFVFPLVRGNQGGNATWALAQLILTEIVGMTSKQIEAIKAFADRIADYVNRTRATTFLKSLLYAKSGWEFRNALVKEQRNEYLIRRGSNKDSELLFRLEDYLSTFAVVGGSGVESWSLVRDLISIRLIERLHELGVGAEILPELEAEDVSTEPETVEQEQV